MVIKRFLGIKSRLLGYIQKGTCSFISLLIISIFFQIAFGKNPLFDNEILNTSNIYLLHIDAYGNPKSLMFYVGCLYLALTYALSFVILSFLFKEEKKDYYLIIGQVCSLIMLSFNFLMMYPRYEYFLPMGFALYIPLNP